MEYFSCYTGSMQNATIKEVYDIVDRIEKKIDGRLLRSEVKIDKLESRFDTFAGAIATMSVLISFSGPLALDWIKNKMFR